MFDPSILRFLDGKEDTQKETKKPGPSVPRSTHNKKKTQNRDMLDYVPHVLQSLLKGKLCFFPRSLPLSPLEFDTFGAHPARIVT